MAEEKNKKSIIASVDSDDEYSGEGDGSDSEHAGLISLLVKLSLAAKKKLLVLSLSGLLLLRVHKKDMRKKTKNRSPDASCGPNLVYKRPYAEEFIKFCLERFDVGIWSSACENNVDMVLSIVLEDLEDKLLFVWVRVDLLIIWPKKPMFFNDLSKVFQCFSDFSASNTIFIDDEPYKALLNPDNTGLFPVSYDASNKNDNLLDPEGEFCSYLDGLAKSSDVQAYIKEHSFGQPKIDSSHPDWSFYRNVSKIAS
ncbi:PREDICTED: uncharacterized protein LOC104784220 [Camelina sativa]|uniref:Mitochondrial import inner membrane translocase subunit TIM50 n=1 Tax=Camelina sativa TaxID=90675 RepID=A0ABM1RL69_CAMSA|nr:PREDICTED: uncharacterized protein LOC104784220 [Camelina sativa]